MRLPRSRRLRRTARPAATQDTIALRKVAEAVVIKVAAAEAAIAVLRHLAVVGRTVVEVVRRTVAAVDPMAEAMADSD